MDHRQEYPERDELRAKFTAWLKVVIRNAKLNYLQKVQNHPQIVSYDEIPESILVMDDPEEEWIRGMKKSTPYDFEEERLAKAFLELPLKRRRIMELLFLEELSEQETAKRLNCSTGHVRKQRNIALKKLRSQLMKDGDAD